jgi:hypothetical protein
MGGMGAGMDTARNDGTEWIDAIERRQVARLLAHLERTGQLTPQLRADILRSFHFAFDDVRLVFDDVRREADDRTEARVSPSPPVTCSALLIAFVQGAAWWEYHQTKATMWQSDRRLAEEEATRREENGTLGVLPITVKPGGAVP